MHRLIQILVVDSIRDLIRYKSFFLLVALLLIALGPQVRPKAQAGPGSVPKLSPNWAQTAHRWAKHGPTKDAQKLQGGPPQSTSWSQKDLRLNPFDQTHMFGSCKGTHPTLTLSVGPSYA